MLRAMLKHRKPIATLFAFLLAVSLAVGLYPKPFVDMSNATIAPLIEHIGGFK